MEGRVGWRAGQAQWLMPVIPAARSAEVGKTVQGQPRNESMKPYLKIN
jgi:hypothetical protein